MLGMWSNQMHLGTAVFDNLWLVLPTAIRPVYALHDQASACYRSMYFYDCVRDLYPSRDTRKICMYQAHDSTGERNSDARQILYWCQHSRHFDKQAVLAATQGGSDLVSWIFCWHTDCLMMVIYSSLEYHTRREERTDRPILSLHTAQMSLHWLSPTLCWIADSVLFYAN
jgi:hypothetical protein